MKLSIITINYNNLEGLKRTYDSVVSQTCQDFEWIIIDGGSTDGSREFIEEHQDKFSYWCSEPDRGVFNAMNKGIAKAKGEYLNFMNSGDCFYDEKSLSYFYESKDSSVDVYYGDAIFFDADGNVFLELKLPDQIDENFYPSGRNLSHQSSFIKASILKNRQYDESYKLAADGELFYWLLLRKYKFKHLDKILVSGEIPGLSSNIEEAQLEVSRFISDNIKKAPFQYKVKRWLGRFIKGIVQRWKIYFS